MAASTIKYEGMGNIQSSIALPFTAPSDGFIILKASSNGSSAYYYCDIGAREFNTVVSGGLKVTNTTPIKHGETITNVGNANIGTVAVYFMPLE